MQEARVSCQCYPTVTGKKGVRHSKEWLFEGILLCKKSRKTYLSLKPQYPHTANNSYPLTPI